MKYLCIISHLLLQTIAVFSQPATGIDFRSQLSWQEVLKEASAENKLVFVDLYTTWRGPCKRLEKEIFTRDTVAEKFNASFINYRIEAEKGEGIELANRGWIQNPP